MDWQPIETAPKDGRLILAWSRTLGWVIVSWRPDTAEDRTCWRVEWDFDYLATEPIWWQPLTVPTGAAHGYWWLPRETGRRAQDTAAHEGEA